MFLPKGYYENNRNYPVIYVNGEMPIEEIITELSKAGQTADFILLSIKPGSWNDDFTPWSAPAFCKGEDAPSGKADAYLACLTEKIKPYMDNAYRTQPEPEHTALFGYSLGGLAAVYAIYKTDAFGMVGSLSGSLWYDGFCEFMEKERPFRKDIKVYLSLGKKESQSRNPRMSRVAECTERARNILCSQLGGESVSADTQNICSVQSGHAGQNVFFEWNEGGHFHDIPKRFVKAVIWWKSIHRTSSPYRAHS
ncbi:MAG: alpha/beta hydrolase-fold protein [Eubacterium sp.]|nr:alpha/beta hydrolase-fold protein [Eubacterium sp.]